MSAVAPEPTPAVQRLRPRAITLVTLTLIVAGLLQVQTGSLAAQTGAPTAAAGDPTAATARLLAEVAPALGWTRGPADASVTIVEFSDLSCPYCAEFHADVRARLITEFVEPAGATDASHADDAPNPAVRWITLSYVAGLYPNSLLASEAVECAAQQGAHETYLDRVYRGRDDWLRASRNDALDTLRAHAQALDLDLASWHACLDAPAVRERIRQINALAREVGIRGTPTWVVDGFPVMGALPLDYARSFIEQRLKR